MSRQIALPLNAKPFYNTDSIIEEAISSDDMWDCYLESVSNVGLITRRRPALVEFADLGTAAPGDGIYYWDAMQMVIAVSNGRVFNIASDGTPTELTGTFNGNVEIPALFAAGQTLAGVPWLYIAANGLTYTTNGTSMQGPSDPNTPLATHVAWINGRFVANVPDTNQFLFTDTNPSSGNIENDYWSSTDNPLTAEARGDKLSALFSAFLEIYCWGSEGLEVWQDDGTTPFSPIQSAFSEAGIEGKYAFNKIDNTLFALCVIEGKRSIIRMNARSPQVISEPIARILADMDTVSDAICDIISVGGLSIALFSFPSAGQSWAYDYKNDTWLRWGNWDAGLGEHNRFLGQHSCFAKAWNKHLIMSRLDGRIYELKRDVYTDEDALMVSYRRTGWLSRGTHKRKRISQLFIKGKVISAIDTNTYTMLMRWRDNGNPTWSAYAELDLTLNVDSQGNFIFPLNRMGMYRSRQYEFRLSDNVDMVIASVHEDVEVMRN
jgi:hypothetical protein